MEHVLAINSIITNRQNFSSDNHFRAYTRGEGTRIDKNSNRYTTQHCVLKVLDTKRPPPDHEYSFAELHRTWRHLYGWVRLGSFFDFPLAVGRKSSLGANKKWLAVVVPNHRRDNQIVYRSVFYISRPNPDPVSGASDICFASREKEVISHLTRSVSLSDCSATLALGECCVNWCVV